MSKVKDFNYFMDLVSEDADIQDSLNSDKTEAEKEATRLSVEMLAAVLVLKRCPKIVIEMSTQLAQKIEAQVEVARAMGISARSFQQFLEQADINVSDFEGIEEIKNAYEQWLISEPTF